MQASLPKLTRSSLRRCLQRQGIARLPDGEADKRAKKTFNSSPSAFSIWTLPKPELEEGKLHLFVAIDRTSEFVMAKVTAPVSMAQAQSFLQELIEAVPYTIHTVLTDKGIPLADTTKNRTGPTAMLRGHPFERVCRRQGIEHPLARPNHLWTKGQVERMNRTLKEVTVNGYFY